MTATDTLEQAREAFARRAWGAAHAGLAAADSTEPLSAEDLQRLAVAAYLTGRDTASHEAYERAHRAFLDEDEAPLAARCAFWLGMSLVMRGEMARGGGWLARAGRVVEHHPDCAERGYLLLPAGIQALEGDPQHARALFGQAAEAAERFADPDLTALARLGLGRALVRLGDASQGLALLDEAMVSVQAGEVSPIPSGIVYCAVIEVCQSIFDVRRAQEWTAALSDWCASQPDLVPYRGQCLVHRSEILQLHGKWDDALAAARGACDRLSDPPGDPAVGAAYYQEAELRRLRGQFAEAEEAYRRASQAGRSPQPGLAQLRLAQGKVDAAAAGIGRALDECRDPGLRARMLAAQVDIALAGDDLATARAAAGELSALTETLDARPLRALSAHVSGAVVLVGGDARAAVALLRDAWTAWSALEAPFEAAQVRVLLGLACREVGDEDGAQLEFDAARAAFAELGAAPEFERLRQLQPLQAPPPGGLTGRELEVLRLIASGRSNRAIAKELVISEHTVARHVQNIFAKLGVESRTAAAAFAYDHDLARN